MTDMVPGPYRCPECSRTSASTRGLAIHRSRRHGVSGRPKNGQNRNAVRRIDGFDRDVVMTCWCETATFWVPKSWVGTTAPSCDDGCYRRGRVA